VAVGLERTLDGVVKYYAGGARLETRASGEAHHAGPFTWRPTGWFAIGFSAEFSAGTARPLKYFGQDLVAYRTEAGDLHALDAHCLHRLLIALLGTGRQGVPSTLWDDLEIWRYQIYVENPVLAQQDARPYGALRKWARQFYDVQPAP
jgi:3-Ketosteroid 9alpha-hydroxylase C-terminal domain/Rieske [2Fe-2S] domain